MTCASVTIRLRGLIYVNLANQSVTYVSGTFVTLDSGLNTFPKGGTSMRCDKRPNHPLIVHCFCALKTQKPFRHIIARKAFLIDLSLWFYKPSSYPIATSACFL